MIKLERICGACDKVILEENPKYPNLCDECAEKQEHLIKIRERLLRLNSNKYFIKEGDKSVICPYCGSRAKIFGNTVKMIQCDYCGLFARKIDENHEYKLYFMIDGQWTMFHYERDLEYGSVWEMFDKIDKEREQQKSIKLDHLEKLKN